MRQERICRDLARHKLLGSGSKGDPAYSENQSGLLTVEQHQILEAIARDTGEKIYYEEGGMLWSVSLQEPGTQTTDRVNAIIISQSEGSAGILRN